LREFTRSFLRMSGVIGTGRSTISSGYSRRGPTILKFYMHIDKDEQKKRLQQRLDDPSKRWKFSDEDLPERKLWKEYMKAYQDALNKTSRNMLLGI